MTWGNGYCQPRINPDNPCPRIMGFQEHLPSDLAEINSTREFSRFTGSATLNFTKDWLASRLIIGIDKGWDENEGIYPLETVLQPVYPEMREGWVILERPVTELLSLEWSSTARLSLTDAVGTATSVGFQYNRRELNTFGNVEKGLPSSQSRTVNQTVPSRAVLNYNFISNKSVGFYIQEKLSFNDRIFVTGAVSFDDNSAFGADLSPETYPKLSATWTLSDESFWNVDMVNFLG